MIRATAVGTRTNWLPPGLTDAQMLDLLAGSPITPSPPESPLPPVTHYASPTGGGTGGVGSPFLVSDFVALPPSPGDHLQLLSGTITNPLGYSGPGARILPANGVHGTPDDRIVISAEVDGGVVIDGGGNDVAILNRNNYWLLQGFNAHNGEASVFGIFNDCVGVTLRRMIGWDADGFKNSGVFNCANSFGTNITPYTSRVKRDNLVVDCAAFGNGRSMFIASQFDYRTTFRRCWGQMEYWSQGDGSHIRGVTIGYQSHESLAENVIMTMDMDPTVPDPQDWRALLKFGRVDKPSGIDINSHSRIFGCIVYNLAEQNNQHLKFLGQGFGPDAGANEFKDCVWYTERLMKPRSTGERRIMSLQTLDGDPGKYTNITEIDTAGNDPYSDGNWIVTNRVRASSVGAAPNPFQPSFGAGARVYFRYKDGVLTTEPLWPWPMDERIREALIYSGRSPDTMFRGVGNGVTGLMESIWGPIV